MRKLIQLMKKEIMLLSAFILALLSTCCTPFNIKNYFAYLNLPLLALLFCLMAVVAGLSQSGALSQIRKALTGRCHNQKTLALMLMLFTFFAAMLVTNDVILITVVPLTIGIYGINRQKQLIILIVAETVAANLGSMATPIGNPQNLFCYTYYQMPIAEFFSSTLPITVLSLLLLSIFLLLQPRQASDKQLCALSVITEKVITINEDQKDSNVNLSLEKRTFSESSAQPNSCELHDFVLQVQNEETLNKKHCFLHCLLLCLCLLTVLRVLDYKICLLIVCSALLIFDRGLFLHIDYSLLLIFICFFIFVGNLNMQPLLTEKLQTLLNGRELPVSAAISQLISNVPAAALLAPFTENAKELLLGVNIGGLGTPIASLASLISLKIYAASPQAQTGKYLIFFTLFNFVMLIILLLFAKIFLL